MARSDAKRLLPLMLLACGVALAQSAAPPKPAGPMPLQQLGQLPINLDAASSEVDYKTNTVVFRDVVISQGALRVQADHARATGLNFANSKWTFEGNVRINAEPRGSLRSDTAVVEFQDNHIARATAVGKPANFEQQRAGSEQMAYGHADQIVYDVNEGTVRLTDDAWLCDGQSEISGSLLVYNIRGQSVQAGSKPGDDRRVHILIQPNSGKQPASLPGGCKPQSAPQS